MSKFKVLAPDSDPTLSGFPVEVSEHKSVDAAISAAKEQAAALKGRASTVLIEEPGTQNAWTVQYHPEPPVASGEVDEFGVPQFKFEPEYRIVYDGTEYDEDGNESGPREVTDLEEKKTKEVSEDA